MTDPTVNRLLDELRRSGVHLSVDAEGGLKVSAPAGMAHELLDALREHKAQVVALLQRAQATDTTGAMPKPGSGRVGGEALTPMQRSLWLACQIDPTSVAYNMPHAFDVFGAFDPDRLRACLQRLQQRHGSLRTRFVQVDGEPRQVVAAQATLDFDVVAVDAAALDEALATEASRVFDMVHGPLFVVRVFRLGDEHHVFVFNTHHIVFDGWSCGVLLRELGELYEHGPSAPLPSLPFDYVDFSRWQSEQDPQRDQRAQAFWREHLHGAPATLDFPLDAPRPARAGSRGASVRFDVPVPLAQAARALCQRHGVTLHQLLMSAFQVLLYRYSQQRDMVIGVPSANRGFLETEALVGYFVNPLPVRQTVDPDQSFVELLRSNRQVMVETMAYQDYPFEKIVECHNPTRSLSHAPLFQHMFSFQAESLFSLALCDARVTFRPLEQTSAKYDLLMTVQEGERLGGSILFNTDLFDARSAQRWCANYVRLLEAVCADGDQPIGRLPLLHHDELRSLACLDRRASSELTVSGPIQARFEQWARERPGAPALRCGAKTWSYAELDARANALARHLQENGVGAGDLVGLCVPRTLDLIAGLIGVLKIGAAYVPLDPKYPKQRLRDIAKEADLRFVLCDDGSRGLVASVGVREVVTGQAPAQADAPEPASGDLSHVIYTSGSTGRPKGVMITHRNVLALLEWVRTTYRVEDLANVLCSTSVCFDISVFEIWAPLSCGGTIVLVENATELCAQPQPGLSLINTVPSALRLLVDEAAIAPSVRVVNVAGEPLPRQLVNDLFAQRADLVLYNLYGPTEDTTYSTWFRMTGPLDGAPAIGVPIEGSYGRVLDRCEQPVPVGAIGELYLGGNGVARGYLNRPDLNAKSFCRAAIDGRECIEYRTGDLVRLDNDGQLHYVGRADNQVKLRGFRIELEEIEHVLRRSPDIADACVLVKPQPTGDILVAYVVPIGAGVKASTGGGGHVPRIEGWERLLRASLPEFMVPGAFVTLERLPTSASGKVDRRALLEIAVAPTTATERVPPRNDTEQRLAGIWQATLKLDEVGIHDDFFRLGGNSLLATQMLSRVNKAFGTQLGAAVAFECKSVAQLAERLRSGTAPKALPLERVALPDDGIDAAYPQLGAWHIANMEGFETFYNMVNAMWIDGCLDLAALERSLDRLVERQQALRVSFTHVDGALKMRIAPQLPIALQVIDAPAGLDDAKAYIQGELEREYATRFDLRQGPLIRARLYRLTPMRHVLMISIHHLVSDAWSINIVKQELAMFYREEIGAVPRTDGEPAIRYSDYAYWQRQWHETSIYRQQIEYWHAKLAQLQVKGTFPTDTGAPVHTPGRMNYLDVDLAAFDGAALGRFAAARGTTHYVIFMTALVLALASYSGVAQQMVYSPVAGRTRQELEESVGLYVNMITVTADLDQAATVEEALDQINRNVREAHASADVSMMAMMQQLKFPLPALPSVVLNVIDLPNEGDWKLPGLTIAPIELERDGKPCLTGLDVYVRMQDGRIKAFLGYNTALFERSSGERLAASFMAALAALVHTPTQPVSVLMGTA